MTPSITTISSRLFALRRMLERFDGEFQSTEPLLDELDSIRADVAALEYGISPERALHTIRYAQQRFGLDHQHPARPRDEVAA